MWLYAVRPNRNETKRNAVAKSHLKMHNKNLFIGLGPLASPHCILVSTRLVSSRLDLTWLFSRLVGQCYVNLVHFSFSYIYFFCFFFLLVFYRTHNTLNLLHKNPNNSTNIYGRSQQKSIQFSLQPPRTRYSRLFRPPYARLFRSASMWIRLTGLAALHSKDASCADRTR